MWHNLATCRIVYDRDGELEAMKKRFDVPCPEELRDEIIRKNRALLSGVLPSYDAQIRKAWARRDLVSVNHRTTEFLASYFDIIFAMNGRTHPGEKRLVTLCTDGEVNDVIARMVAELDRALLKVRPGEFTAGQLPMGAAEKQ